MVSLEILFYLDENIENDTTDSTLGSSIQLCPASGSAHLLSKTINNYLTQLKQRFTLHSVY